MNMFRSNVRNRQAIFGTQARGPACPALRKSRRHGVALSKSFAVLAGMSFASLLGSCTIASPNFDEYSNLNLIPNNLLGSWTPDQEVRSISPQADIPNAVIAGSAPYMRFERIDNAPSGNFAADTGFADAAALYDGLPTGFNAADGSRPPVYRLELTNLLKNGDFEDSSWPSGVPVVNTDTHIGNGWYVHDSMDADDSLLPVVSAVSFSGIPNSTRSLQFDLGSQKNYLYLDFSDALLANSFDVAAHSSYNFSFDFANDSELFSLAWGDKIGTNYDALDIKYNSPAEISTVKNFPLDTALKVSNIVTNGEANEKYLALNPWAVGPSGQQKLINAYVDNFSVIRTDRSYNLAWNVAKLTGAQVNGDRVELQMGGTYVFTLMVRNDPTAGLNNRFSAKKISLAIHTDTSRVGENKAATVVSAGSSGTWAGWTQVSVSVANLIQDFTTFQNASENDNVLQINIAPLDTTNSNTQVAGSLLISAPRLYWSPNL